jgi:hypothetical protein
MVLAGIGFVLGLVTSPLLLLIGRSLVETYRRRQGAALRLHTERQQMMLRERM